MAPFEKEWVEDFVSLEENDNNSGNKFNCSKMFIQLLREGLCANRAIHQLVTPKIQLIIIDKSETHTASKVFMK